MAPSQRPMRQCRCRPCLERLEDRLTPASVRILNAPPTASEGATINLGVQFIDDLGIAQPTVPPGTFLLWRVTNGASLLGIFQTSGANPTFPFSTDIALDDGKYTITLSGSLLGIQLGGDAKS